MRSFGEQKKQSILLNPLTLLVAGVGLGIISRLLDIYSQNLGEIFSQMAIWILFGVLISVYSESAKKAMCNILPFCLGMLVTYYAVAIIKHGVYGTTFIIGWTIFAFGSPVLAFFAWQSKEKGIFPCMIRMGIVAVSVLSSILLFDRLRIYDFVIDVILVYILFFKKIHREQK